MSREDRPRLRLFGTTAVSFDDADRLVTAPRQRAVLARLALHPGSTVAADVLLDDIWGKDAPVGGVKAVAYQIAVLRDLLEPSRAGTGTVIATDGNGYRLLIERDDVDLVRFETLIDNARAEAVDDAPNDVLLDMLHEALAMWTAPPYAGLAEMPWTDDEVNRLASLRRLGEHELIRERMRRGQHRDVIIDLERLIGRSPLDEGLVVDLATAFRASGRMADALRCCSAFRRRLADDLGIDPSPALRSLERELLQHTEAELVAEPNPATNARRLAFPADSFVGRDNEVNSVKRLLDSHRLVTITGAGGIGKTRLATHVGLDLSTAHPDGVWIVELSPLGDPANVPGAIATALGLHVQEHTAGLGGVERFLRSRNALVILDNCEHVLEAAALAAEAMLAAAPQLSILATSRESLGVAGEHIERLAPLAAASELFRDRARAARSAFDDVDDADGLIRQVCEHVDGIPLGIELAAVQVRSMSLPELAERIGSSADLGRAKRGRENRRTLDAAIRWSADTLDDDARRVFRHLSVFSGGCDAPAIEAVCGPGSIAPVTECLDRLVDKSLVETRPGPAGRFRYGLLEPIRNVAADDLRSSGEHDSAVEAHAQHFLDTSFDLAPVTRGFGQRVAVAQLAIDAHNIATAAATLHTGSRLDDELDLCWNLFIGWRAGVAQQAGVEAVLAALADGDDASGPQTRDPSRVARAWYECAHLALDITMPESVDYAQNGIDIARSLGDDRLLGRLLICQACAVQNATPRTDGGEIFDAGERLLGAHPEALWWDEPWEAAWFDMIRSAFGPRDDLDRNRQLTTSAAEAFGALGDRVHQVLSLMVSAFWGIGTKHHGFVEGSLRSGLEIARHGELGAITGHVALYQAFIAISAGDRDRAGVLLAEAVEHLGALPPEVAAMVDASDASDAPGAGDVAAEHASLAATISGTATAISGTDDETAMRLRRWANNETAKRP